VKDEFELFEKVLTIFSLPITGWTVAAFVLLFFLRKRIGKWIDQILDGIGATIGGAWSYRRFMRRYNALVRERHQTIKLVGIRTEQERRPLIEKAYVPLRLRAREGTIESHISIEQIAQEALYSIILGDPGAGKSTLLEYVVQLFTKPATTRSWLSVVPTPFSRVSARTRLPFYVPLRRCLARNKTLLDDILNPETRILPEAVRQQMPKKFVERCLKRKEALLLLDGLDEVADDDAYKAVIGKVNDFRQLTPGNTVVVTCRLAGWRADLEPEANVFLTLSLDFQQQSDFVRKWYAAILHDAAFRTGAEHSEISGKAEREADHLLNLLRGREHLRELAGNPLLLALVCLLHRQKKNLPRSRADLYQDCIDILLFQWDQADKDLNQTTPSIEQKKKLLRHLAYKMHKDVHEFESLKSPGGR
jgi:predicted NACHT family NTPase